MLLISTTNSYAFKNSQRKVFTERLSPSFFMKSPKNTQLDNRWKPPPPPPVSSWNPSRLILGTLFASFGMCGYAAYGVLEQGSCGSCRGSWGCKVLVGVFVAIPYQVDVKKNMFLLKMYTCTSTHVWTICTYIYIYMSLIYIYTYICVVYNVFLLPRGNKTPPKIQNFLANLIASTLLTLRLKSCWKTATSVAESMESLSRVVFLFSFFSFFALAILAVS